MRITVFIILVSLTQAFALSSYSQHTKISLDFKKARVEEVIDAIENSTEFYFLYNKDIIDVDRRIDVNVQNGNVTEILDKVFNGTDISYSIRDRLILLINSQMVEYALEPDSLQPGIVSGKITDSSGSTLPGVTVIVMGTTIGGVTNTDGEYSISNIPEDAVLQFSFVGMKTKEMPVEGKSVMNVVMEAEFIGIDEVVAIGYGSVKKKDLTGAVASVDGVELTKVKGTQLSQVLQGTMPGVTVTRSSSLPGASATIRIRGITSISESDPLIIVDGIPYNNIDDVNPNDIENMTVLKDAASASIYGARAAAGVIVITTKNASNGEINFEFDTSFGFEKPTEFPSSVGATRYLEMANEMTWNDAGNSEGGEYSLYTEEEVENWVEWNKTNPNEYPITDWVGLLINDYAPRQRHQFSFTYGGDRIKSRASVNYEKTDALYDSKSYERITTRVNNKIKINNYFSANIDFSYNHSISSNPSANPIKSTYQYAPIYAALYDDGRIAGGKDGSNMYARLHYGGFDNTWRDKFNGKISLEFKPWEELSFTGVIAPYFHFKKNKDFDKQIPYYEADDPTMLSGYISGHEQTSLYEERADQKTMTKQFLINYQDDFSGGHNLNIMAGYEDYSYFRETIYAQSEDLELSNFPYLDLANLETMYNSGDAVESAYCSVFGRLIYDYKKKYYLQSNFRYDGSSRFHPDYRWAFFPSVSVGWAISEEPFMKNFSKLSFMKLRASWGNLGNERIGYYPYQSSISYSNAMFWDGDNVVSRTTSAQLDYAIEDISWETTETWNIGLDANFFNNKLSFSGEYYSKKTKDMLLELEIPDYTGFGNPDQNAGIMTTKGWELKLSWHDQIGDFSYSASVNVSDFKSEMGDLSGTVFLDDQIIEEGSEYYEWYGYVSNGLYQTQDDVDNSAVLYSSVMPGDVKYVDISGADGEPDGQITPEYDKVYLGGSLPRYCYGGNINIGYKNFDFSLIFQGVGKQNSRISAQMVRPFYSWWTCPSQLIDGNYWSYYNTDEENLNVKYPRLSYQGAENNNYEMSDYWLINGAYFRLKNITLGYTIPRQVVNKIKLKNVRVYTSISDLFKIDHYPEGWDPEATYSSYISCTYNFGVSVKF